jgi:outer membrane protein assembly factor BamB
MLRARITRADEAAFRWLSCLLTFAVVAITSSTALAADPTDSNWPQFRGSRSTGVSANKGLPVEWSTTKNVEWKVDIEGRGWGSPIVWGDRVFVSTVVNLGENEPIKKGLYFGGDRPKPPASEHAWHVLCLNLKTGAELWDKTVHTGAPATPIHLKNSYASETPVTDGTHVYFCFGNVGLFCFDMDGNLVWKKELPPHAMRYGWGTAASPVLYDNVLYYVNDNDEQSSLTAYDARTGNELWSIPRDEKSNWSTPYIWKHEKGIELVTAGTGAVRSYDLQGKLLWSLTRMSSITIAMPYSVDGLLYVSSGYVLDPIKAMYAIKPGASGDLTLGEDQTSSEHVAWANMKIAPYNPSTIVVNGRLYILYDRGLLACFDAATGREIYGAKSLKRGTAFTASPWSYEGHVFFLNEDGVCIAIQDSEELNVVATNSLAEDDICLATPAIAGDRLLIRSDKRLYCIRKSE